MDRVEHKIECVVWTDSAGAEGWHEPQNAELSDCVSVGWISLETDKAIVVTSHIEIKPRNHHADMVIPKCSIIKRTEIKGI